MIVMLAFISVMITVTYMTFTAEYVYEATATLSIRDSGEIQNQIFNMPSFLAQKSLINNQVTHLQSRTLAAEVISALQKITYADSLQILGYRQKVAKKTLKTKILARLGKKAIPPKPPTFQDLILRFQRNARVTADPESDIIYLKTRSSTAWEAAILANSWVRAYKAYSQADTRGEVVRTKLFIENKLAEIESQLARAQKALADYQKKEKVVSLSEETQQLVEQSAMFQSELDKTRTNLETTEKKLSFLRKELKETHKYITTDIQQYSTPAIKSIQDLIGGKESERASLEAQLISEGIAFEQSPQLRRLQSHIDGLKKRLTQELSTFINTDMRNQNPLDKSANLIEEIFNLETEEISLNARKNKQKTILAEYKKRLENLPDKSLKLASLELELQVTNNLYFTLRENHEQIKIREAGQMDIVKVVDLAEPPRVAVMPKKGRNLFMGFFFGMLLGVGMAYSRDYFQDAIRSAQDIEKFQVRLLGSVIQSSDNFKSLFSTKRKSQEISRAKSIYPHLIAHKHTHSSIAEAYRSIRTALYFSDTKKPWRTLLVTSPNPSEGKSTTAANLAITIAQKGVKTLLIDADLRKPVIDILFTGSHRKHGFANILSGDVDWHSTIRETTIHGLYIMGAGLDVKNASELISSRALPDFITEVRKEYGAIIFDSAPILPVTDTVVLSSLMDGVILVVKANQTPRESLMKTLKLLKYVKASLIGAILTGIKKQDPYAYSEYFSNYVDYSSEKITSEG